MLYILLGVVGIIMLAIRWSRGEARNSVALFLVTGAAIGFGDLLFNRLFPLYTFRPGLLAGWADNALGAILSDALFVPAMFSSLMPVRSRWKWVWMAVLVVPLVLLEAAFSRLGLFRSHGWSLWLTVSLFGLFFAVATWFVDRVDRHGYTGWRRAALLLGAIDLYHVWEIVTSGVLGFWYLKAGLLGADIPDRTLSMYLYHGLPLMAVGFVTAWTGWARSWAGVAACAVVMSLWLMIMQAVGIYHVRAPWSPVYGGVGLALIVLVVGRLDAWFEAREHERTGALL